MGLVVSQYPLSRGGLAFRTTLTVLLRAHSAHALHYFVSSAKAPFQFSGGGFSI